MLSILIPVYNFAVKNLVNDLSLQAQNLKIPFEILCIDDASKAKYVKLNDGLEKIKGVNYQLNKKILDALLLEIYSQTRLNTTICYFWIVILKLLIISLKNI